MAEIANSESNKRLPDEEFIRGLVPFFITQQDKTGKVIGHIFVINRDDETREYTPVDFLLFVMKAHYVACDKADSFEEQLRCVINAKTTISRYIWNKELDKLGYNFQRIFDDLELTKELIETNIKCNFPYVKMNENENKQTDTTTDKSEHIKNTIDEYLEPFKITKAFNENEYPVIIETLKGFFENKKQIPPKPYFVSYGNTKKLAYALGCIYSGLITESLAFDYVYFCQKTFICFSKPVHKISEEVFIGSTLYKYFVSKPK